MIQRINLIEKEPFKFSYQKLVAAVIGVFLFCAVLYGFQIMRIKMNQKRVSNLTAEITWLKAERERLLKTADPQFKGGPSLELKKIFDKSIPFSKILNDISHRLPGTVWLTGFQTKQAKGKITTRELELSGNSRDLSSLSTFMNQLKQSPFIAKIVLKSSKKNIAGFTFKIDCDIIAPKR